MSIYIFRNNTIEYLFQAKDYKFSGYDDISYIPDDVDSYIWFYQIPLSSEIDKLVKEINGYTDKLHLVLSNIDEKKRVLIFTLALINHTTIVTSNRALQDAISSFNNAIFNLASKRSNIKVIDISDFYSKFSSEELIDWRMWFISQSIINIKASRTFKAWFEEKVRAIEMKRKKCIVLDLDNTLWGGILGEDGVDGIKIGGDYPGKAFAWWQKALLDLSKSGVILAVCSKNNEADVNELWEKNPFMILKKKYISAHRINWIDKATNIQEIAKELNIGLDSMVFIDDNPTERELVKSMLPMVTVPEFPDKPYLLPRLYDSLVNKYFQVYALTNEDLQKAEQYRANAERAKEVTKFANYEDYLRSLDINIKIDEINNFNLPRISQMTQKTNQFNLTTNRYTESDLQAKIDAGWKIWCISVSDRFGDNGITGCLMINGSHIDTFLLSCRILGKGIEMAFIKSIFNVLKSDGLNKITAKYIRTQKNEQVADFYERCGFNLVNESENTKEYELDLSNVNFSIPDYYNISYDKNLNI